MKVIFYDATTGRIHSAFEGQDDAVEANTPVGFESYVVPEGEHVSVFDHRIDLKTLEVVERDPDPVDLAGIARQRRDAALAGTDWTQLKDIPAETADSWASYRQELRDLTDQPGFPDAISWPETPAQVSANVLVLK